ncbi:hypothetical protein GCM10020358_78380 [Amorphoplanes nipponensis]|uniref:Uncharacterized protein n=1 Tax=Actinoplanes nipponensis TaxID=135950 RepID=A0A919JNY8_9ACTN|nr:hypothetical protein [Actinoplanes nipponensis]GIE52780.1 hypothetical protein Ani05nite_63140 [Actinoplanes nipponensis]
MDLHRQFDTLAGPEVTPTMDDINADLDRGRRALRRRRTVQKIAGSAFAVAALAVGFTIATNGTPAATTPAAVRTPGPVSAAATRLVAYTGSQPKGYTIDKVPDGWEIQADDPNALILAPKNALDKDPNSFVGKIGIMLQSRDQSGPGAGKKVTVGDVPGVLVPEQEVTDPTTLRLREEAKRAAIAKGGPSAAPFLVESDADDGATLWVKQPSGVYLLVQFWEGLGLSERDMLEIGAGVHVHKDAVQGRG